MVLTNLCLSHENCGEGDGVLRKVTGIWKEGSSLLVQALSGGFNMGVGSGCMPF